MKNYNLTELSLFILGYMILSTTLTFFTGSLLSIWMGINVALAIVPMILITLAYKRLEKNEFAIDVISVLLIIVFIFFLPNTFYIITDFIHLDSGDFYVENIAYFSETTYREAIEPYALLIHILFSALIGIYMGVKSLMRFEDIFKQLKFEKKELRTVMNIVILLSAVGIYIGRFLRLFSWEMLNPIRVITMFTDSLSMFTLWFVLLFILVQWGLLLGYKLLIDKEPF